MNPKVQQRALRGLLAGLLQSELDISDIQQVSDELIFGSFGKELSEFIRGAIVNLPNSSNLKSDFASSSATEDLAYELILRRKMAKKAVQQLMSLASPAMKRYLPANGTMRELIEKYFAMASLNEKERFIRILEGEPADAYMKGIARRDRSR